MKPYELVTCRGVTFAYHQALGRFIRLTPAAAVLLAGGTAEDPALRREADRLRANGFFDDVPGAWADDAAFEAALAARDAEPSDKVELSLAETCNLACRYCYCGTCRGKVDSHGLMPPETAVEAVERLFAATDGDVAITFFGGEPLLDKPAVRAAMDRAEALAAARGTKVRYVMTTNATLVDDETAETIASHDFGLMVSMDGPKALHDAQCPTRDGGGSWEAVAAGCRRLLARRGALTVRCTMTHPAKDPMELVRFFLDFGFTRIVIGRAYNPAFPSAADMTEEDVRRFDEAVVDRVVPWMLDEIAAGRRPAYDPFDEFEASLGCGGETVGPLKCGACHGTLTVGADGALYPCHRFVGMERWKIGTLKNNIVAEKCREFWYNYRHCIESSCSRCWAYRICKGPCPWEIARQDGTFAMNGRLCEETKRWIAQGAWFAAQKERVESKRKAENGNA